MTISSLYATEIEPFKFQIKGFKGVEVLDIEGDGEETVSFLGKDKMIYFVDLEHKKIISKLKLNRLKNPVRFTKLNYDEIIIIDQVSNKKVNIVIFNTIKREAKVVLTLSMNIKDIIYTDTYNIALLSATNKLYTFSIKEDGSIGEIEFNKFDDSKEELYKKYTNMIDLSDTISNVSNMGNIFSFVSQQEKTIYLVDGFVDKIQLEDIPNSVYPLGCCLNTMKYMIIAYKGKKGVSFVQVKASYNKEQKQSLILKLLQKFFCPDGNHYKTLKPLVDKLTIEIHNKFLEKNKNNIDYKSYPKHDSYTRYNYVTKEETFKLVEEILGCSLIQTSPNDTRLYQADCIAPNGLKYFVEGHTSGLEFELDFEKGRTDCYINFRTRKLMDFKEKSEGKNAGYEGYCIVRNCPQFQFRQ